MTINDEVDRSPSRPKSITASAAAGGSLLRSPRASEPPYPGDRETSAAVSRFSSTVMSSKSSRDRNDRVTPDLARADARLARQFHLADSDGALARNRGAAPTRGRAQLRRKPRRRRSGGSVGWSALRRPSDPQEHRTDRVASALQGSTASRRSSRGPRLRIGGPDPTRVTHQLRFACAIRPQQRHDLTRIHPKVEVPCDLELAVTRDHAPHLCNGVHISFPFQMSGRPYEDQ